MRFVVYLFLYFLIWILCIWILLTLNSSKLISDSIAGLFTLAITVICIVLFVQQMMNTKTKRKANKRITRQPRLNRYENKEVNYQDIFIKLVAGIVISIALFTRNGVLIYLAFVLSGIYWVTKGRTSKKEYLFKHSERLRELEKINVEYARMIKDYKEVDYVNHKFTTKKAYDARNETLIFYQYLMDFKTYTQDVLEKIKHNRIIKRDYEYQLQRIFEIQPIDKYSDLEASVVRSRIHKIKTDYKMSLTYSYTSAQGRNHFRNSVTYTYDDIIKGLDMAEMELRKRKNFEYMREQERAKMTRSMRYDVFVRDKFQCRICGASREDGIKLHVDHIYPIARGGKTIMSNLQTLCEDCNVGKWDKVNWSNQNRAA